MKIIEVHPTNKHQWDDYFESTGEGNICQSFYWDEIIEQLDNAKPIFLKIFDDDGDVSYLLLFRKKRWNRDGNNTFNKLCGYFYQWIELLYINYYFSKSAKSCMYSCPVSGFFLYFLPRFSCTAPKTRSM